MILVDLHKKLHTVTGPLDLNIAFSVKSREIVSIFGVSGVGKTTVLRMIAGLTQPDRGYIEVNGQVWFDSRQNINLPVQKRSLGFVAQQDSLFPHMTVQENLCYALSKEADASMIEDLLRMTGLISLKKRYPHHLSSGQKQRVALIRAVLRRPNLFLLDEPLSALDHQLRRQLQDEIILIHQKLGMTTLLVSHDLGEVFKLSNRIIWLEDGRIKKQGAAREVFSEQTISGKFKFTGVVVDMEREEFLTVLTIEIGQHLTKVVVTQEAAAGLEVGDRILVSSKAFNPIIMKYPVF